MMSNLSVLIIGIFLTIFSLVIIPFAIKGIIRRTWVSTVWLNATETKNIKKLKNFKYSYQLTGAYGIVYALLSLMFGLILLGIGIISILSYLSIKP